MRDVDADRYRAHAVSVMHQYSGERYYPSITDGGCIMWKLSQGLLYAILIVLTANGA